MLPSATSASTLSLPKVSYSVGATMRGMLLKSPAKIDAAAPQATRTASAARTTSATCSAFTSGYRGFQYAWKLVTVRVRLSTRPPPPVEAAAEGVAVVASPPSPASAAWAVVAAPPPSVAWARRAAMPSTSVPSPPPLPAAALSASLVLPVATPSSSRSRSTSVSAVCGIVSSQDHSLLCAATCCRVHVVPSTTSSVRPPPPTPPRPLPRRAAVDAVPSLRRAKMTGDHSLSPAGGVCCTFTGVVFTGVVAADDESLTRTAAE